MALRSLGGGTIFADVSGRGWPLVVGLHGWGRERSDMGAAVAGLPGTVACLDLPGHGTSPEPPEAWSGHDYATAVGGVIDELMADVAKRLAEAGDDDAGPAGRVLLVGHSFGGRVAVCLAADRPELVSGLVLAGVPLLHKQTTSARPALGFRVARRLHAWHLISDTRMEALRRRYGSADYAAAQGVMRQVLVRSVGESYESELTRLQCPVALVWGENDTAAPVDLARRAQAMVTTPCTLDVVDGVGHDIHTDRPDRIHERAEALLADPDPDPA
jgi:pimeloyl-ACP methyl ester carboxylesterase